MGRKFLMGNEAVALGALHAGAARGIGYPGTPSSEILDVYNQLGGKAEWAPNEKVAAEVALGVSFAGVRAFTTMKHVGLNVAADVLFTAAYSGVDGALVFVVADDPGLASSQDEQDSRRYAVAAGVPLFEPSDSQEAYDYTRLAFEVSERWKIPVLLKLTTRVCHSGTIVMPRAPDTGLAAAHFVRNIPYRVMVPGHARPAHRRLRQKLAEIAEWNETDGPNQEIEGSRDLGILVSGVAYQHAREAASDASFFKVGMSYPLPMRKMLNFIESVKRAVVIEENDPVMADAVRAAGGTIESAPEMYRFGELNVSRVKRILAGDVTPEAVPPRGKPPQLCAGCPHGITFDLLKKYNCIVAGDIGCYTLAALPPLSSMDTQICMGASLGTGLGLRHVLPREEAKRVVSVIGDSTFVHSGLTGLAEMTYNVPPTGHVLLILDNTTTAMTGQQEHPGTGRLLDHSPANQLDYEKIARAMNVPNVGTFDPIRQPAEFEAALVEALAKDELTVLIVRRPCILAVARKGVKPATTEG
ncbi:MAG: thiamine pyrophosphate-dependent enzyme [Pontiellaceae bacterium]|jgi:indolepyruvate ferredoxin oxidoreductase alpha subunit|nr:thiamine pyrophosphate-dependent enzyme [Pontiellaceae bacterium]